MEEYKTYCTWHQQRPEGPYVRTQTCEACAAALADGRQLSTGAYSAILKRRESDLAAAAADLDTRTGLSAKDRDGLLALIRRAEFSTYLARRRAADEADESARARYERGDDC